MDMEKPFKVSGDIRLIAVTQKQLANALKLSPTRINELCKEKIILRDESSSSGQVLLFDSLRNYFLSKKTTDEGINYWTEKARHEKAKRELAELKLQKERAQVYDAAEYEAALVETLTNFKTRLTGLGHKLARQLQGKTADLICDIIDDEIISALEEFKNSTPKGGSL